MSILVIALSKRIEPNFEYSARSATPVNQILPHVGSVCKIKLTSHGKEGYRIWGLPDNPTNGKLFNKIEPGDYVAFCENMEGESRLAYAGKIIAKEYNEEYSGLVWPKNPQEFSYMFYIDEFKRKDALLDPIDMGYKSWKSFANGYLRSAKIIDPYDRKYNYFVSKIED